MSITLNTNVYSFDSSISKDKVQYTGPDHTFSVKDSLTMGRTAPKPTATFNGVARSEFKRTKTVVINATTGETAEAIITVTSSLPVGMLVADADDLRDDVGDFIISAEGKLLQWNHDINQ